VLKCLNFFYGKYFNDFLKVNVCKMLIVITFINHNI